jgi:hypothetical protein
MDMRSRYNGPRRLPAEIGVMSHLKAFVLGEPVVVLRQVPLDRRHS